jgi:hypothetical protein
LFARVKHKQKFRGSQSGIDAAQTAVQELEPLPEPDVPTEYDLPEEDIRTLVRDEIRRLQQ